MTISTLAELQTALTNWGVRDDQASLYPDFIALFEAWFNRRVRVRQMEATATVTMSGGVGTLPTDYLVWRQVIWPGAERAVLKNATRDFIEAYYSTSPAGTPKYFTIEGSSIYEMPIDDTSLTFHYYQKLPSLASGANWLIAAHPDAYLWGSLAELFGKVRDIEKAQLCIGRRDAAINEVIDLSLKSQVGALRLMNVPTP